MPSSRSLGSKKACFDPVDNGVGSNEAASCSLSRCQREEPAIRSHPSFPHVFGLFIVFNHSCRFSVLFLFVRFTVYAILGMQTLCHARSFRKDLWNSLKTIDLLTTHRMIDIPHYCSILRHCRATLSQITIEIGRYGEIRNPGEMACFPVALFPILQEVDRLGSQRNHLALIPARETGRSQRRALQELRHVRRRAQGTAGAQPSAGQGPETDLRGRVLL